MRGKMGCFGACLGWASVLLLFFLLNAVPSTTSLSANENLSKDHRRRDMLGSWSPQMSRVVHPYIEALQQRLDRHRQLVARGHEKQSRKNLLPDSIDGNVEHSSYNGGTEHKLAEMRDLNEYNRRRTQLDILHKMENNLEQLDRYRQEVARAHEKQIRQNLWPVNLSGNMEHSSGGTDHKLAEVRESKEDSRHHTQLDILHKMENNLDMMMNEVTHKMEEKKKKASESQENGIDANHGKRITIQLTPGGVKVVPKKPPTEDQTITVTAAPIQLNTSETKEVNESPAQAQNTTSQSATVNMSSSEAQTASGQNVSRASQSAATNASSAAAAAATNASSAAAAVAAQATSGKNASQASQSAATNASSTGVQNSLGQNASQAAANASSASTTCGLENIKNGSCSLADLADRFAIDRNISMTEAECILETGNVTQCLAHALAVDRKSPITDLGEKVVGSVMTSITSLQTAAGQLDTAVKYSNDSDKSELLRALYIMQNSQQRMLTTQKKIDPKMEAAAKKTLTQHTNALEASMVGVKNLKGKQLKTAIKNLGENLKKVEKAAKNDSLRTSYAINSVSSSIKIGETVMMATTEKEGQLALEATNEALHKTRNGLERKNAWEFFTGSLTTIKKLSDKIESSYKVLLKDYITSIKPTVPKKPSTLDKAINFVLAKEKITFKSIT